MHKPIKYAKKGLTYAAKGAWVVFDALNQVSPSPGFTPTWSDKPLLKSWQKVQPPLGWPRETDSLCPVCVREARQEILDLFDGLKPVHRRILHAMKELDDGQYNKVANIIGHTMQFHPHGDASIGDALVQLGQKDLLVDAQGNWGNILTGDGAAAPRYIEARLSKFALDVVFNPKITEWKLSYDGRNKEPVTLPVKFPLLLALGVEGIAVGLASNILPHNFNELIDASIDYLQGKDFVLYPDFPTAGMTDIGEPR